MKVAQPLRPPSISIAAVRDTKVAPVISGHHVQVQVVVVVHVAQQVQPPGAITTALADVQVAPTLPVKRSIAYTSFRPGSVCVYQRSSVVQRAESSLARSVFSKSRSPFFVKEGASNGRYGVSTGLALPKVEDNVHLMT